MPRSRPALLALLAAAACGGQSPQAELRQQLQDAASWVATARLTGEAWLAGSVPTQYAARTLDNAAGRLDGQARTLLRSAADPHSPAPKFVHDAAGLVDRTRDAVERGDRAAVRLRLSYLDDEARFIAAITPPAR